MTTTASTRPPHQTPRSPLTSSQRGNQRDASRGGTPSPRRHPQRRMAATGDSRGCNPNVLVGAVALPPDDGRLP